MDMICFLPLASVTFAFRESNLAGKFVVVLLFAGSIVAWSIMITKLREFGRADRESRRFLDDYRRATSPLALFLGQAAPRGGPLAHIYSATCEFLGDALDGRGGTDRLTAGDLSKVRSHAERAAADEVLMLEDNMGYLATAVTAAPFLGLLGTVWGVMDSFGGMATSGSTTLNAVAPGISGALLTTVVGLVVALPSLIGYNVLVNRLRRIRVRMGNFLQEFLADIERHLLPD